MKHKAILKSYWNIDPYSEGLLKLYRGLFAWQLVGFKNQALEAVSGQEEIPMISNSCILA